MLTALTGTQAGLERTAVTDAVVVMTVARIDYNETSILYLLQVEVECAPGLAAVAIERRAGLGTQ